MRKIAEITYDGFVNKDDATGRFSVLAPGVDPEKEMSGRLSAYNDKDVRVVITVVELSGDVWE